MNNIIEYYNWLMEYVGTRPFYELIGQFRNSASGSVRQFKKKIYNKKDLKGEELNEFLQEKLRKFIEERECNNIFSFIPYSKAIYKFKPKMKKQETFDAVKFFDEDEKLAHEMYRKLATEKAKSNLLK